MKVPGSMDTGIRGHCHMCNCKCQFVQLREVSNQLAITLGDGSTLQAAGRGDVVLRVKLPGGKIEEFTLHDVLYMCLILPTIC